MIKDDFTIRNAVWNGNRAQLAIDELVAQKRDDEHPSISAVRSVQIGALLKWTGELARVVEETRPANRLENQFRAKALVSLAINRKDGLQQALRVIQDAIEIDATFDPPR